MTAPHVAAQPGGFFCHLLRTALDFDVAGPGQEIVRVASAEGLGRGARPLVVAFRDGRVVAFLADGSKRTWLLPPRALGSAISAIAAAEVGKRSVDSESSPVAFAGTEAGLLELLGPDQAQSSPLGAPHAPAPVTALLFVKSAGLTSPEASPQMGVLLSADAAGRVVRTQVPEPSADGAGPGGGHAGASVVLAELRSHVLALEMSDATGGLLASTAERIVVIDGALEDRAQHELRPVGSKAQKGGQLTATFSGPEFGREALIASRPGGRLWVADGSSGTVQTTLRFHRDGVGSGDRAALGRLVALGGGKALSWMRSECANEDAPPASQPGGDGAVAAGGLGGGGSSTPLVLLDLQAIAVTREWHLPQVVDVCRWGPGRVAVAQRDAVSVLLMSTSAEASLRAIASAGCARSLRPKDFEEQGLRDALEAEVEAADLLALLEPFFGNVVAAECGAAPALEAAPAPDSPGVAEFKRWVADLEERATREHFDSDAPAMWLAVGPLANFPLAERAEILDAATASCEVRVAEPRRRRHLAEVCEAGAAGDDVPKLRRRGLRLAPEHLRLCSEASSSSRALPGGPAESSAESPGPGPPPGTPPAVARSLFETPHVHTPQGLRFLEAVLRWIADVLEAGAEPMLAASASAVSAAFELLCLRTCQTPSGGDARSAWPRLGFAPRDAGRVAVALTSSELVVRLRAIAAAAAHDLTLDAAEPSPASLPAACAEHWTPAAALALCRVALGGSAVPGRFLERCLFRANGLAASGDAWPAVVAWLQARVPTAGEAAPAWDAALARLRALVCGSADVSQGTGEVHALLRHALRHAVCVYEAGAGGGGPMERARQVMELALEHFPRVLPWNLEAWVRAAVSAAAGAAAPNRHRRRFSPADVAPDILAGALVQALLRLLPTCRQWADFDGLLQASLSAALHGHRKGASIVELHVGGNAVVDALIQRFRSQLDPAVFQRLAYPLGVVRLCDAGDPEAATRAVGVVLQILAEDGRSPVAGEAAAPDEEPRTSDDELLPAEGGLGRRRGARFASRPSADDDEELIPAGRSPATEPPARASAKRQDCARKLFDPAALPTDNPEELEYCRPPRRATATELELAAALWKLAEGVGRTWVEFLGQVVDAMVASGGAPPRPGPLERLLVALATQRPGPEVCEAARRAEAGGALSGPSAAAVAAPLMAAALLGEDGAPWLVLPPALPPPPMPRIVTPPRPEEPSVTEDAEPDLGEEHGSQEPSPSGAEESGRAGGFCRQRVGEFVEVAEDGLTARHLDDTGDQMHGVVLGADALTMGRAGLYFEVELLEVRPGESYDGLTIGVTATRPDAVPFDPQTCEHLPMTWAVGYDGQMWDAGSSKLSPIEWDPRDLCQGDRIGVLVTCSEGELLVFRNGVACCPGPRGIPVESETLFAVVDLLGAARAVRWCSDATAPVGDTPSHDAPGDLAT